MGKKLFHSMLFVPFLAVIGGYNKCELKPSADQLVVLPGNDNTPPSVTMDVHFSQVNKPFMSATENSQIQRSSISRGEILSIVSKGTDEDGGCRSAEIWVEITTWNNVNESKSQSGPGLMGSPTAQNKDNINQAPGSTVRKSRLVSHKIDVAQLKGDASKIRLRISAKARNYYGGVVNSGIIELEE